MGLQPIIANLTATPCSPARQFGLASGNIRYFGERLYHGWHFSNYSLCAVASSNRKARFICRFFWANSFQPIGKISFH